MTIFDKISCNSPSRAKISNSILQQNFRSHDVANSTSLIQCTLLHLPFYRLRTIALLAYFISSEIALSFKATTPQGRFLGNYVLQQAQAKDRKHKEACEKFPGGGVVSPFWPMFVVYLLKMPMVCCAVFLIVGKRCFGVPTLI